MSKWWGRICGLCLVVLLMGSMASAESVSPRWKLYNRGPINGMNSLFNEYYDSQSLEYMPNLQVVKVWTKDISQDDNDSYILTQLWIDYSKKTWYRVRWGSYPNTRNFMAHFSFPTIFSIGPDLRYEKLANIIADRFHLPHLYPVGFGQHQWKKIYSTNGKSFYLCMDTWESHLESNRCIVWIKKYYKPGRYYIDDYCADFTTDQVGIRMKKWKNNKLIEDFPNTMTRDMMQITYYYEDWKDVLPESLEEAIYNGARELYQSKGK